MCNVKDKIAPSNIQNLLYNMSQIYARIISKKRYAKCFLRFLKEKTNISLLRRRSFSGEKARKRGKRKENGENINNEK